MRFWLDWDRKTKLWAVFALAMAARLAFIIPWGNNVAAPFRDQNTYYALGRGIVDDGHLGPPVNQYAGPYYEFREKHPPPLGKIPQYRLRMYEKWDAEQRYYGVVKWGAPTAFYEPLYPLFSALSYYLFGDRFFYPRILLAIISSLTCIVVFHIGRRIFSETAGYIAAAFSALYPYFIFYTAFLMSETFTFFFFTLSVLYFVKLKEEQSLTNGIIFGLTLGLTFLTRSIILGLVPFLLILLIWRSPRRLARPVITAALTFIVTISPWVVRNYLVFDEFVLLSTRGGYNIWLRNNPYFFEDELKALGAQVPQSILDNIKYRQFLDYPQFEESQDEVERNRILTDEGMKFIKANPRLFAFLCWVRFKSIVGFSGTLSQGLLYKLVGIFSFGLALPLSVISLVLFRDRWRDTLPFVLIFLYLVGVYTLTHDGVRYRLPADPFLIIMASAVIERILSRFFPAVRYQAALN